MEKKNLPQAYRFFFIISGTPVSEKEKPKTKPKAKAHADPKEGVKGRREIEKDTRRIDDDGCRNTPRII
jgi:hypothetical protein